jgi:predicted porin
MIRIAIFVIGCFGACESAAQSVLTFSGELNIAINQLSGHRANGSGFKVVRLDSIGSNIRLKGSEDLGNGLRTIFFLSGTLRVDTGAGGVCRRDCYVGLEGKFGVVKLGHLLPIYDDVSLPWYYISAGGNHNPLALWANCGNGAGLADGCLDNYLSKTIRYNSPRLNGWSASVSRSDPRSDLPGVQGHPRIDVAGVEYRQNNLYWGFAMQYQKSVRYVDSVDFGKTLSFEWKGDIVVGIGLEHLHYTVQSGGGLDRNYVGFLLRKTIDQNTVWFNYGRAGSGYGSAAPASAVNQIRNISDSSAKMLTLGFQHKLSKNTQIFVYYNTILNDKNARYSFDSATASDLGAGQRLSSTNLALTQRF